MIEPHPDGMTHALAHNITLLQRRRAEEQANAPWADRLAGSITRFTGSMLFVAIHATLFGGWITWNLWGSPKFDPSFVVLAMIASVEAIFLSTFVLISQNRMQTLADRRADLDLHINLLTEHELTKLSQLVAQMAERMGIPASAPEVAEIQEDVRPERVLDALDETRPD